MAARIVGQIDRHRHTQTNVDSFVCPSTPPVDYFEKSTLISSSWLLHSLLILITVFRLLKAKGHHVQRVALVEERAAHKDEPKLLQIELCRVLHVNTLVLTLCQS